MVVAVAMLLLVVVLVLAVVVVLGVLIVSTTYLSVIRSCRRSAARSTRQSLQAIYPKEPNARQNKYQKRCIIYSRRTKR